MCVCVCVSSRLTSDVVGDLTFRGVTIEGSCKDITSEATHEEHNIAAGSQKGREGGGRVVGKRSGEKERESGLTREPYTCERLSCISGGYQQLTDVHPALFIDFTNPEVSFCSIQLFGCSDSTANCELSSSGCPGRLFGCHGNVL